MKTLVWGLVLFTATAQAKECITFTDAKLGSQAIKVLQDKGYQLAHRYWVPHFMNQYANYYEISIWNEGKNKDSDTYRIEAGLAHEIASPDSLINQHLAYAHTEVTSLTRQERKSLSQSGLGIIPTQHDEEIAQMLKSLPSCP